MKYDKLDLMEAKSNEEKLESIKHFVNQRLEDLHAKEGETNETVKSTILGHLN